MGNVMESGLGGGFYEGGCQSQTYKSNLSDWLTRYNAYGALGMQELKGHYDSILSIMGSANDDIDNSGIDFVDLKKIELAYTSYDVEAMEKMRKNLTDFALTVHSDAKSLIDDVIDLALLNLKIQISDHEELKITYLGTPFDLEYNIEDPKHLSDWLYKSVDGSVDDFLYTGDRKKDNLIKEFIEKDEDTGRYVFEDKMDEWSTLSDDEKEVIRHLTVYYGGQYDAYYDDTNEFAKDYKDKEERILTKCVKIESRAADSSNPDTYDPENPGSRVFVYSEAGKGLMGMVDKNSYTGQLIGGLSKIDVDLYDLARNCNPTGNKDFQYIYGDQNSGVTFKIKLSHDRAATAISLGLSYDKDKDPKKTEANRQYYETYKDSFDAINEHLAQEEPYAYFTDYRRSLGYVDRTIEKNPTTYEHVENMGMDKTRVALIISKAENPYDMECLDELTKTNGSYDKAFSIDANKLSDSAKDQIKEYVGIIKNKAYSDVNPHSDACWEELVKLCAYFDDADSKELAGYWPICEKDLAKTRTDLTYMAFRQSPYYSPEFESRMMMAEQMASGAPYSQAAKDEWFKDSQNQEAYYVIMRAKHPDLVGAKWEDMSKEQRERYGDISKVFDESHRMIMLNNIEDVHKAEALYMIDEKNGLNADVYAICDKIKKEEKLNPFTKVSDPYSLLTEDEKKKVETYVLRNCVNPSMTQQGYEALDKLSEVVTNHIEQDEYYQEAKKKTIGKPILKYVLDWTKSGGLFIPSILDSNNDKYEYCAIKRGSQQDILYLAAKEAHNTAYVMDEAWETGLVHYGDAFVHGVGSIIKTSENLDYFIEKKIGWGDETYQQYIDYENQVINRNFDQAQAFSPLLYGTGEMARDLVLMYYGGQIFEASGATKKATKFFAEKLATKAGTNIATKLTTGAVEVVAEQIVPTVVSVIPKAAEGIAEGKSGEEVLKDALFEEGINLVFSGGFRIAKAVIPSSGRAEIKRLYMLDKEEKLASKADDIARAYKSSANPEAFLSDIKQKEMNLLVRGLDAEDAADVLNKFGYNGISGKAYNSLPAEQKEEVAKLWFNKNVKKKIATDYTWAKSSEKEFLNTSEMYAQKAVNAGALSSEQEFYEMYLSREYKYPEEFIKNLKQEYLDKGASSVVGEGTIKFVNRDNILSIGRKPDCGRADGCFVTTLTEDNGLLYDSSGKLRDYKEIAQMKGVDEEALKNGIYQYYYDQEFIQNCEKAGIFEQVNGTNSGANVLNIPGGRTWAGNNTAWSETEMICPTIDISQQYKGKDLIKILSKKDIVIHNPQVYLADGSKTVIKGTFTIRKLK